MAYEVPTVLPCPVCGKMAKTGLEPEVYPAEEPKDDVGRAGQRYELTCGSCGTIFGVLWVWHWIDGEWVSVLTTG